MPTPSFFAPSEKGAPGHGRPQAPQGRRLSAPAASFTAISAAASVHGPFRFPVNASGAILGYVELEWDQSFHSAFALARSIAASAYRIPLEMVVVTAIASDTFDFDGIIAESDAVHMLAGRAASDGAFFSVAVPAAVEAAVSAQLKGAVAGSQPSARFLKLEEDAARAALSAAELEADAALIAARFLELEAQIQELKADAAAHRELSAQHGLPRVRSAAAAILSMVREGLKKYKLPSKGVFDRADYLREDPKFASFGKVAFPGLTKEEYMTEMAAMFTRRGTRARFASFAAMREEVAILAAHYLTAEMRALAEDECVFIDMFEAAVKMASGRPLQPTPASGRTPSPAQARKKSKKRKQ